MCVCVCVCVLGKVSPQSYVLCIGYNIEEFCESVSSITTLKYVWDIPHSSLIILKFQIAFENQPF
jgi:hypothetical protein